MLHPQERAITTVREQLDNLLSLLFNIETVEQGRTVGRLSVLAFVFVPLSFVAMLDFWEVHSIKPKRLSRIPFTTLTALETTKSNAQVAAKEEEHQFLSLSTTTTSPSFHGRILCRNGTEKNRRHFKRSRAEIKSLTRTRRHRSKRRAKQSHAATVKNTAH
ncbi:hypothetical protein BU23DRAFT_635066 [Bimuria novae-zelandiae CBS 107.79]|uniref:Uncharacterized protein n=1 Tax=Bimuria novae-zelandiae CBS 107.79 TaxID=1447943 RepID=A0A6A5VCZ8_9PLEO|nr:hypothetical protein BU23DRAFT_635066 [Bimuria novae-zelandiae CBS 107.79]